MKKIFLFILIITYILSSFTVDAYTNSKLNIPEISKVQAIEISKEYIEQVYPELTEQLDFENGYNITFNKSFPYVYNVTYNRIINDISYGADNVSVIINGDSGEIVDCLVNFTNIEIPETTIQIDDKLAQEKFISAMGLELRYNKKISDNTIQPYLTYSINENFVINAETGNTISIPYELPTDGYFNVNNMSEKTPGNANFDASLISITDADSIIRKISEFEISDNYNASSANYLVSQDNTYLITITYTSGNNTKIVTVNAITGIPVEYENNSVQYPNISKAVQTENIDKFASKYYSEYISHMPKQVMTTEDHTVCLYERHVNGIPYKSNGLYICYNNYGILERISFAWDNIKFSQPKDIITYEEAYEVFFKKCGLELSYFKRDNNQITPVYRKSAFGTGIIDAENAIQLNYDGSVYHNTKNFAYLDIENHFAEEAATKLSDCDIFVSSGHVYLNDFITQEEYLLLISELISGTKPILNTTGILTSDQKDMLYTYMYSQNILKKDETNYYGYITRADAIKYLLTILGYGTVGNMHEIFIKHFVDSEEIPESHTGYIELARSLGIINGYSDNTVRPMEYITNAESLIMVYNYLKK